MRWRVIGRRAGIALVVVVVAGAAVNVWWKSRGPTGSGFGIRHGIPQAISPEARRIYEEQSLLGAMLGPVLMKGRTVKDFERLNTYVLPMLEKSASAQLQEQGVVVTELHLGGVKVLEIRPPHYQDDGTVLLRAHGGGWVLGSALSGAAIDALTAISTGKRVLSVEYTLATRARWPQITDEVIGVYRALLGQGYSGASIGMVGASAGGNILAGSVLKLRDQGLEMPGALILISPALDLAGKSDTWTTLRDADPIVNDQPGVVAGATLYAPPADWENPYVSPVHGDFTKGYPPVLLQLGTREVVLSDSVRMYQALKAAGREAELDIYEGMPHLFQGSMTDTPEQKAAFNEQRRFWARHLVAVKK